MKIYTQRKGASKLLVLIIIIAVVVGSFIMLQRSEMNQTKGEVDPVSEQMAVNGIRAINEAEYTYYMYNAGKKSFAHSIEELGYVHENDGAIAKKDVWNARIGSSTVTPLGRTRSEYLFKVLPIKSNNEVQQVSYVVAAIPQKGNLPAYISYIDGHIQTIAKSLLAKVIRVSSASKISDMKKLMQNEFITIDELVRIENESGSLKIENFEVKPEQLTKVR